MIDTSGLKFAKPCHGKRQPAVAVFVMPDGREICNLECKAGQEEYKRRRKDANARYGGICQLCGKKISSRFDLTTDHIIPRGIGGSTHDDRSENLWPAHLWCNGKRGSRRVVTTDKCEECGWHVLYDTDPRECTKCGHIQITTLAESRVEGVSEKEI